MKWYAKLALRIVRKHCPEEVEDRSALLARMRAMAGKLNDLKSENEEWRQRAFSAERVLSYELHDAFRDGLKRHNDAHGTCIQL